MSYSGLRQVWCCCGAAHAPLGMQLKPQPLPASGLFPIKQPHNRDGTSRYGVQSDINLLQIVSDFLQSLVAFFGGVCVALTRRRVLEQPNILLWLLKFKRKI
jgi:hypothetical protein